MSGHPDQYGKCFYCRRWYDMDRDHKIRTHDNLAPEYCPGSDQPPISRIDRETAVRSGKVMVDSYGICGTCRRPYYITSSGGLHIHKKAAHA